LGITRDKSLLKKNELPERGVLVGLRKVSRLMRKYTLTVGLLAFDPHGLKRMCQEASTGSTGHAGVACSTKIVESA